MSIESENRKAIVDYRTEKAALALEDAYFLIDAGKYNLAANRLYYALYYAASALLISKGIETKTHSGLITQISMHLVKTGILSVDDGKLLKVMFELRHEGDYEDFIEVQREDIEEYTPRVRELVDKLKNLISL